VKARFQRGLIMVVAAAIASTAFSSAPAVGDTPSDQELLPDVPTRTALDTALPPVSAELMDWASATQEELSGLDEFSTVRLSDDRTGAEIYWHGQETPALDEALDEVPAGYWVDVAQTTYLPGALRDAAESLLAEGVLGGMPVTSTWANPDGSGVSATLATDTENAARRTSPTATHGFPLTVTAEELAPAVGRQNDNYHMGGSRLRNATAGNGCTLGFAVALPGDPATQGGMFASHCTAINDRWVRPSDTSQVFSMGTATAEVNNRDGAILTGTFFSPGVYIGSYTSDAIVYITGVANPVQNTEICYSGSYSGTVCGSLVSVPTYNYSLASVPGTITGVRTAQTQGYPAAGNGDSGGPGVVPVSAPDGGVYLWAGTIISAIPTDSPTTCQGVPGGGASDRRCSHIVASTKAHEIATTAGWLIRVVNP
jgi:hypothetical protein